MNSKEILQTIVAEDGSCSWIDEKGGIDICAQCPMSKLKTRPDGNYYSCVDSLAVHQLNEADQDAIYKAKAEELLLEIDIEDMLKS